MVSGIFHQGSGLGNQLHRYVATRVLALDKDYKFGMLNPQLFKGKDFMDIDMGFSMSITDYFGEPFTDFNEKKVVENGVDIRGYDPEFNFIKDGTVLDGEFQDERYFGHRMKEIDEWIKVGELYDGGAPDDLCVIGFRGGEFSIFPDLFLTQEYWDEAIEVMKEINPQMRFEVHTDDEETAKRFFPNYLITHHISYNWRAMRYAKYAIIANSSFFILPRLLNGGMTIAPRYWARRNKKVWALPQNYYKQFTYI